MILALLLLMFALGWALTGQFGMAILYFLAALWAYRSATRLLWR